MAALAEDLKGRGRTPVVLPLGASYPVGNLGYANAALEIAYQANAMGVSFDAVVMPTSSGGTLAGLAAGFDVLGASLGLIGVDIDNDPGCLSNVIMPQIEATKELLGHRGPLEQARVEVLFGHAGAGYGHPTSQMQETLKLAATREGLLFDPVYSAKALAGFLDLARSGRFTAEQNLLFLHTGGSTGLFGYRADLQLA